MIKFCTCRKDTIEIETYNGIIIRERMLPTMDCPQHGIDSPEADQWKRTEYGWERVIGFKMKQGDRK